MKPKNPALRLFLALLGLWTLSLRAEEARMSFEDFVSRAEKLGSELSEQEAKVEFAKAREALALSAAYPHGSVDFLVGPSPGATGNAIAGQTIWSQWGAATGVLGEIVQPLYTFGALGAGREAARIGTDAEKRLLEKSRWALRTEIAEYYFGYQLAFELGEMASQLREKLEQALKGGEGLEQKHAKHAPSPTDLDKLRVYLNEVLVREDEAQKGQALARAAMKWKIGAAGTDFQPRWDRANLKPRDLSLKSLSTYTTLAKEHRPEFQALQDDVQAKKALLQVQEALELPSLYIGGRLSYFVTPVRTLQPSPFAYDPLNSLTGGLGLGVHWDLGIFERDSKKVMARAELKEAQARNTYYQSALLTDVEKSFDDLAHEIKSLSLRAEGSKAAHRVFQDAAGAFSLGSGSAKDMLEALGNLALAEKSRFENIYNENLCVVKLEQSLGQSL